MSYRWSSGLVIVACVLVFAIEFLLGGARAPAANTGSSDSVGWDPCSVWEQMPATVRLAGLVCVVALPAMFIQGLRNRSVPWWLAAAGLAALVPAVHHQLWFARGCYSSRGMAGFWICNCTLALICLHHIIQRPQRAVT